MYKRTRPEKTGITINKSYIGETIEEKVERVTQNNEPITDGAPIIYTERKDGVMPDYDIRADIMEIAAEGQSKTAIKRQAARGEEIKARETKKNEGTSANTSDKI